MHGTNIKQFTVYYVTHDTQPLIKFDLKNSTLSSSRDSEFGSRVHKNTHFNPFKTKGKRSVEKSGENKAVRITFTA
jgi:hypothetical protein